MKGLKIVTAIMMVFGLVLIVGAVGTSDYMSEIGQYYPLTETMKNMGIGFLLMVPFWIVKSIDDRFEIHIKIYRKDW